MSDLADKILDPQHRRANVRAVLASMADCHARGVPIPEALSNAIPIVAAQLMKLDSPRMKAAGAKLVLHCIQHNFDVASFAEKMGLENDKLDKGIGDTNVNVKLYDTRAPVGDV